MKFKLKALTATLFLGSSLLGANAMAQLPQNATAIEVPAQSIQLTQEWDKIFPKSDKVEHRKVTFKNRYGITLVGDLYVPKGATGKLPAIAVSGPFGAVKEQSSGLYAQHLAERGFVTVAFDGSFTGESSGLPRNTASPEINTDDFVSAVDFLGSLDNVDREKIGVLGICGWGGFALNSAISDPRIKAVATSTMYDMTQVMADGYEIKMEPNPKVPYERTSPMTTEARYKMKQDLANARWEAAANGYSLNGKAEDHLTPQDKITAETPRFVREYSNFYKTKRGFHPRSVNSTTGWNTAMTPSFINMPILQRAGELKAPALVVHGEFAHSRYFGEDAYKALGSKNKELYIVPGANHTDLYDDVNGKIPYDKFEQFFKANLK
ncbi:alpha/beta hydrolase [[Mannheimia] succiniciproducens]|uniref:Xaa-Pro dipeptidyl-peptidase-like domain-containing protein n=1 Tax=Mannheimia succiniciproducens (strain KCTC 0769BP / MBEL55E) TaxID=221988 RepID=Q65QM4_MANSM|nr:alpha/beta hydrolase [[Mannheimia] succiniciproducens]AAU38736.1 unknown [[Mannheimia] succiniciproducens MBEL55E]